jgi:hypothetical protein
MLTAPLVVPPLTPWTREVLVRGQRTGSNVEILVDGSVYGSAVADGPEAFIPLDPARSLAAGQTVAARQRHGGDVSVSTPESARVHVLADPTPEMLGGIFAPYGLLECATCLWLEGVVPGAEVTVSIALLPPVTVSARWAVVHVDIPLLGANAVVRVRQGRGAVVGPDLTLPPPLPQTHGHPIPAPKLARLLCVCDRMVELEGVYPGATVTLDHDGEVRQACFGLAKAPFWLTRGLKTDDKIRVKQAFSRCQIESEETRAGVHLDRPSTPGFPYPVCAGDREVEVTGLHEGAVLQFLVGKGSGTIVTAEAGRPPWRFILPPLVNTQQLGCRQSTCGDMGPWSDTAWIDLVAVGSNDQPVIEEPVVKCGAAVGVWGLSAGTRVSVVSSAWGGSPIGDTIAMGDALTDVPLYFGLKQGDALSLEVLRCGQRRLVGRRVVVQPAPDLLPPLIFEPLDDAGGTISVDRLVPGAFCDVEQVASMTAEDGILLASHVVTRSSASVPVPPLPPGMLLRVRQRLCGSSSRPSVVARTGDRRPLMYEPGSTYRICQLTGTWGDGHRPARYDTNAIGLRGTDLGVPAWHQGKLYLFFGDANAKRELESMEGADPIAWTSDSPEGPGGPYLNWAIGDENIFHRLHLDGLPPLGLYEVPTGAFSYDGRLYVFVGRDRGGPHDAMQTSHLGISKEPNNDPATDTLDHLFMVSSRADQNAPARKWLIHVSPTVIRNEDWPGLPESSGDGLLLFGSSDYQHSGLYLAWTKLSYGVAVPLGIGGVWTKPSPIPVSYPDDWYYFVGNPWAPVSPANWIRASDLGEQEPTKLLPEGVGLGEVSVTWHPPLGRWLIANLEGTDTPEDHARVVVRSARKPWGPWSPPAPPLPPQPWQDDRVVVFDGIDPLLAAGADNFEPGHRFVGLPHEEYPRKTGPYAPYLIPAWTRFDRSTRTLILYYTMSTEHPPYEVMLMRSHLGFR